MIAAFSFFEAATTWVAAHQALLLMVVSCLYAFEQWLGSTDKLKSNTSLQLVGNFISGFLKVTGLVYKLSTGKAMVVDAPPPAAPILAEVMHKAIESPVKVLDVGQAAAFQQAFEHGDTAINDALKQ